MKPPTPTVGISIPRNSPPLFAGASLKRVIALQLIGPWVDSPPLFAGASLKLAPLGVFLRRSRNSPPLFAGASLKLRVGSPRNLLG